MPPASITAAAAAMNSAPRLGGPHLSLGLSCSSSPFSLSPPLVAILHRRRRSGGRISCEAASAAVTAPDASPSPSTGTEGLLSSRVGARVRVKSPVKVYHVQKVPELDLNGMEGEIKQFVGIWKGKHISANLPFKVEFVLPPNDGGIKFSAHLKEDEFDYLPQN